MADSVTSFIRDLFRPIFMRPARLLSGPKRGSTWQYEAAFVASVLIVVALLTSPHLALVVSRVSALRSFFIIWISAAAVFGSFLHAQVSTYMSEDMGTMPLPLTECYYKLDTYWVYKEVLWFLVFIASGAYPAIAGNIIFLLYPAWRKIYKAQRLTTSYE